MDDKNETRDFVRFKNFDYVCIKKLRFGVESVIHKHVTGEYEFRFEWNMEPYAITNKT